MSKIFLRHTLRKEISLNQILTFHGFIAFSDPLHQFKSCPEYQWYGALLIVEWLILHVRKCFPHRCRHIGGINYINKPQLTENTGSNRNSFLCIISWLWTSNITPIGNFLPHLVTKRLLQLCHSPIDGYKPTSPAYTTHTLHLSLQFALRIFTQLHRIVGTN